MSNLAVQSNSLSLAGDPIAVCNQRYAEAKADRRRYESTWEFCNSFLQGRQWVGWHPDTRSIVDIPNPDDRVRVTVNVLTQYHSTVVGKLTSEDFRPDITFRKDDIQDQAIARQAQKALIYGWEEEWDSDERIQEAVRKMVSFGTSAILIRPDKGAKIGPRPVGPDGKLIFDINEASAHVARDVENGNHTEFQDAYEGTLSWDVLSPFNMLPPPGIEHERDFPWFIVERPVSLDDLKRIYGDAAANVQEESVRQIDIGGSRSDVNDPSGISAGSGKLRGHAMLKTMYEVPTVEFPAGRVIVWAGSTLLETKDTLPLKIKNKYLMGLVPFKYHPQDARWWAIGLIEPMLGPQKQRNRSRSQWIEMKDRAGLGRVYAHKNVITEVTRPKGGVFELVELLPGHDMPKETQGVGPGPWLAQDVQMCDEDLDKVAGLQDVSLGTAPAGVSAYSAFALLAEQDDKRVGPVLRAMRVQFAKLTKLSGAGMRQYWSPAKEITVSGDSDLMDSFVFNAMTMPEDLYVRVGNSAPLPSSQAAEAQKIFDVFDRAIASGQVLPIDWLTESLANGKMQPLPKREQQVATDKAQYENMLLIQGVQVQVATYDNDELHVQIHRQAQSRLQLIPDPTYQAHVQTIEEHIQMHLQNAQSKAVQATTAIPGQGSPPAAPQGNGRDAGLGPMGAAQQSQQMQPPPPAMQ